MDSRQYDAERSAIHQHIADRMREKPGTTPAEALAFLNMPGQVGMRRPRRQHPDVLAARAAQGAVDPGEPIGRGGSMEVWPPVTGQERYQRQRPDDEISYYRVQCWRLMDKAAELEGTFNPKLCRSIDEYVRLDRSCDAGAAYVRRVSTLYRELDPEDDKLILAQLMAGSPSGPRKVTPYLSSLIALFASYVWHCCGVELRPALIGTLFDLAALLGCSHSTAFRVKALAVSKGLVRLLPQQEVFLAGELFKDREGKFRKRRRDTNAYAQGTVMRVAVLRIQERDERAARRQAGAAPPPPCEQEASAPAPARAWAPEPVVEHMFPSVAPTPAAAAGDSREDRPEGDPSAFDFELGVRAPGAPCPETNPPVSGPAPTVTRPGTCVLPTEDVGGARPAAGAATPRRVPPGTAGDAAAVSLQTRVASSVPPMIAVDIPADEVDRLVGELKAPGKEPDPFAATRLERDRNHILARVRYTGPSGKPNEYYLVGTGNGMLGPWVRLMLRDGSKTFFTGAENIEIVTHFDRPRTLAFLQQFSKSKKREEAGAVHVTRPSPQPAAPLGTPTWHAPADPLVEAMRREALTELRDREDVPPDRRRPGPERRQGMRMFAALRALDGDRARQDALIEWAQKETAATGKRFEDLDPPAELWERRAGP